MLARGRLDKAREQHGLRPLRPNRRLQSAASAHSAEMFDRGYFAHDSSRGSYFTDRIIREHYVGRC